MVANARPLRPFPRWAATGAFAGIFIGAAVPTVPYVSLPLTSLFAIILATWLEDSAFRWAQRRSACLRVTAMFSGPVVWPMVGVITAALGERLGEAVTVPALLSGLWMGSAALGSFVVWGVDGVARRVASSFATWIRTTVLGVLLAAGGAFLASTIALPRAFVHLTRNSPFVRLEVDGQAVDPNEVPNALIDAGIPEFLVSTTDFARTVGDLLGFTLIILLIPALWSAVSKVGERAMDRLHPLDEAMERVATGDLDVRVEVGGAAELARLARRFNDMVEALALARRMETAFSAYVSRPVLERIREQHGAYELPVMQRDATVFFADMRGFTAMSERLPPAQVLALLRRFYREAMEVIGVHEGYVDKFIGDAVYVVFNGPIDQPDHVRRAVRCALDLQALVARLNAEGAFPEIGQLAIGIGVATGPVIAGNLGTQRATQFAVVGDTVNLAARLSGLCPAHEVWVSPKTAEGLDPQLPTTPLEPVRLKGKSLPVTPYRVS